MLVILIYKIDKQTLTYENITSLLTQLLDAGERITPERIIVIILLCSDIIIHFGLSNGTLFNLILEFIRNQVCVWVDLNGGWVSFEIILFFGN